MKLKNPLLVGLFLLILLVLIGAGANSFSQRSQMPQEAPGVCLQGVIIFKNADSVGILWDHPPCRDEVDMTNRFHFEALHRETGYLPYRCGIVLRLPGYDVPVVDTLPGDWICPQMDRQAEGGEDANSS